MRRSVIGIVCFLFMAAATYGWGQTRQGRFIQLPTPAFDGTVSVERAIKERRTIRNFRPRPLNMAQLSQLLWSAQGITDEKKGLRAAPSGGARYPLDVYAVVGDGGVEGLEPGVYRYYPSTHAIELIIQGDKRRDLAGASLGQVWMATAPVIFVITAEYERITRKYAERGVRYAQIEVGHVGQNIFLQSVALGLGAGIVGAFGDDEVAKAIGASKKHEPLIIMPVGYTK